MSDDQYQSRESRANRAHGGRDSTPDGATIDLSSLNTVSVLNSMARPVLVWRRIGERVGLVFANAAARTLLPPAVCPPVGTSIEAATATFPEWRRVVVPVLRRHALQRLELYIPSDGGQALHFVFESSYIPGDYVMVLLSDLTAIRAREQELRERVHMAERYLELSWFIVLAVDRDGIVTYVNPRGCKLMGLDRDELIGRYWFDFIPKHVLQESLENFHRLISGEMTCMEYVERPLVTASGEERTVVWHTEPMRDINGEIVGLLTSGEDITDRKRAEEALRQSEERYRTIVHSMQDMIFVHDKDDRFSQIYTSDPEKLIAPIEESIGRHVTEVMPPEMAQKYLELAPRVRAGETVSFDYSHVVRGEQRWFTMVFTLHEDGKSIVSIARDITERVRAEQALRESEERYRTIFNSAIDGIFIVDRRTREAVEASPSFCKMTGYSLDEALTLRIEDIHPQDELERVLTLFEQQARGELRLAEAVPVMRKDGSTFYADIVATPITLGGRQCLMGNFRDITARKVAEEWARAACEISHLYMDLLTHDITNQLQVILTAVLLAQTKSSNPGVTAHLREAADAVDKCTEMIHKIRATENLLSRPLRIRELDAVLDERVTAFREQFPEVQVLLDVQAVRPLVMADEFLEVLVYNLLTHAVRDHAQRRAMVWIRLREHTQYYELSVADNGRGFSEHDRTHLFDMRRRHGALDLYQAKQIVDKYGGRISLRDRVPGEPDQGSEIVVLFPRPSRQVAGE